MSPTLVLRRIFLPLLRFHPIVHSAGGEVLGFSFPTTRTEKGDSAFDRRTQCIP